MKFPKMRQDSVLLRATCALSLAIGGCATLPSSGPTGRDITRSVEDPAVAANLSIVEVTQLADLPAMPSDRVIPLAEAPAPPTDMVGPGDILDIAIYESGVTLFGGANAVAAGIAGFDSSAKVERLPANRVDDQGYINIPYGGRLRVAGKTRGEIETLIGRSLRGMSQNPQVLVTIREYITNSVIVGGEVAKPGRLVLPTNRETLSDTIALAGGYRGDAKDLSVRVRRGDGENEFRLSDVLNGPQRDIRIYPSDRISIVRAPRSYSVMGAPGVVQLFPFSGPAISLAEAIATAGGANPNLGDPQAIFVFRIVTDENGQTRNIVYHINMMKAGSYFIAQRFAMRDKDVLYIGNARANQPSKLVQIISQLFSPIVTATTAVQVLRN